MPRSTSRKRPSIKKSSAAASPAVTSNVTFCTSDGDIDHPGLSGHVEGDLDAWTRDQICSPLQGQVASLLEGQCAHRCERPVLNLDSDVDMTRESANPNRKLRRLCGEHPTQQTLWLPRGNHEVLAWPVFVVHLRF